MTKNSNFCTNGQGNNKPTSNEVVKLVYKSSGPFSTVNEIDALLKEAHMDENIKTAIAEIRKDYPAAKFWKDGAWR